MNDDGRLPTRHPLTQNPSENKIYNISTNSTTTTPSLHMSSISVYSRFKDEDWNSLLPYDRKAGLPTTTTGESPAKAKLPAAKDKAGVTLTGEGKVVDLEAQRMVTEIKEDFALMIESDTSIGTTFVLGKLRLFLQLKLQLDLKDRIWFARTCYAVITQANANVGQAFSDIFILLVSDENLFDDPSIMPLDWRPLFSSIHSLLYPKHGRPLASNTGFAAVLIKLTGYCSRYFKPEATQEILQEILPKLNVHDLNRWTTNIALLAQFLPIHTIPPPLNVEGDKGSVTMAIEAPKKNGFYWVPTLFAFWQRIANSSTQDMLFFDLFGCLARNQLKAPESIGWTRKQMAGIFVRASRMLGVPVGSGSAGKPDSFTPIPVFRSGLSDFGVMDYNTPVAEYFHTSKTRSFASIIVNSIFPPGTGLEDTGTLPLLEKFIKSIESFAHPSNTGGWSKSIASLMMEIAIALHTRHFLESAIDSPIPEKYRLTQDIIDEICILVNHIVQKTMYGKDPLAINSSQLAFKYLCRLNPGSIFPKLLEGIYPALEGLSETHRTKSALGCLCNIAPSLMSRSNYPAGGAHLANLLMLTLPGLDVNDYLKSISTLIFVFSSVVNTPLVNSSHMIGDENESEADLACRSSTAEFEVWLPLFIERVFTIMENLPQNFGVGSKSVKSTEAGLLDTIVFVFDAIFYQLSPELEDLALRLIFKRAQTVIPAATEAIGYLVASVAYSNPMKRLDTFVPFCIERIKEEIETGASSTRSGNAFVANNNPFDFAKMSDANLHWYQSILMNVVLSSGESLLKYKKDLTIVMDLMVNNCVSKRGYLSSSNLISSVLKSLSTTYPLEFRSHPASVWNSTNFAKESSKRWGEHFELEDVEPQWHSPSNAEIEFAVEIAQKYYDLSILNLRKLMADPQNADWSTEFTRWISLLQSVTGGASCFATPLNNNFDHDNYGEYTKVYSPQRKVTILPAGFLFDNEQDPQHKHWNAMSDNVNVLYIDILRFFMQNRQDDIASIKAVLLGINRHNSPSPNFDGLSQLYKYARGVLAVGQDDLVLPRLLYVMRLQLIHLRRVATVQKSYPTTARIRELLDLLFEFSLGPYAEVRKTAQNSLLSCLKYHRSYRFDICAKALAIFKETGDKVDPDRIKGSLYILRDKSCIAGTYIYYWRFTALFVEAMLSSHNETKPSILNLLLKVFGDWSSIFSPQKFLESMTTDKTLCRDVLVEKSQIEKLKQNRLEFGNDSKIAHEKTMLFILETLKGNLNWRFTCMGLNLLNSILSTNVSISLDLAQTVILKFQDVHPGIRGNAMGLIDLVLDNMKDRAAEAKTSVIASLKISISDKGPSFLKTVADVSDFRKELKAGEEEVFCDKTYGWLLTPKSLTVYKAGPSIIAGGLPYEDRPSLEAENYFKETFSSQEFWTKTLSYFAEQSNKEQFKITTAEFFKRVFTLVQDGPLSFLIPKLAELIEKDNESHSQRAAAEIIAGLFRGSKHWGEERLQKLRQQVSPLIFKAIENSTLETFGHWASCLRYIFSRRDPHRFRSIILAIMGSPLDLSNSSFLAESKKISLKDIILSCFTVRFRSYAIALSTELRLLVSTPYQMIRESFARCFDLCLQLVWRPTFHSLAALVDNDISRFNSFEMSSLPVHDSVLKLFEELDKFKKLPALLGTSSLYSNSAKTVISWLVYSLTSYQTSGIVNIFPIIATRLLDMQDYADQDLSSMGQQVSKIYPNFILEESQITGMVTHLSKLCLDKAADVTGEDNLKEWHVKTRILPIIQVIFYRHLPLLSKETTAAIYSLADTLLADPQVEVRQLASVTLSGILLSSENKKIESLIAHYKNVINTQLVKRKRGDPLTPEYVAKLTKRHSGVLGLCSIVLAFPYDIPVWIPKVLVLLANCSTDPSPISNTITHTFGEFKRTHQDTWEKDKLKFTSDELYAITDLIYSPGYFV